VIPAVESPAALFKFSTLKPSAFPRKSHFVPCSDLCVVIRTRQKDRWSVSSFCEPDLQKEQLDMDPPWRPLNTHSCFLCYL